MRKTVLVILSTLLISLSAYAQSHSVVLTWVQGTATAPGVITGNKVYRGTVLGGPYNVALTSTSPITTFTDTTVVAGTTYYYVASSVCALCVPQESVFSNEAKAVIPANPPGAPTAPVLNPPAITENFVEKKDLVASVVEVDSLFGWN